MLWAVFEYNGQSPLGLISCNMDTNMHVELFYNVPIEYAEKIYGDNWTFFVIHKSKVYTFKSRNVPAPECPVKSPDLNPIENVWSVLSAQVFKRRGQFATLKDSNVVLQNEYRRIADNLHANH